MFDKLQCTLLQVKPPPFHYSYYSPDVHCSSTNLLIIPSLSALLLNINQHWTLCFVLFICFVYSHLDIIVYPHSVRNSLLTSYTALLNRWWWCIRNIFYTLKILFMLTFANTQYYVKGIFKNSIKVNTFNMRLFPFLIMVQATSNGWFKNFII